MQYSKITIDQELTEKPFFYSRKAIRLSASSNSNLIATGDAGSLAITCRDLAAVAWGVYENGAFFAERYGVKARYRNDINGGGDQLLEIGENQLHEEEDCSLRIIFSESRNDDWIYEADLMMDGRKDYDPVRNLGKRKFGASSVTIFITEPEELLEWINNCYINWIQELRRLSRPHSTLLEWVESGLDMGVRCSRMFCENELRVIQNGELKKYLTPDATLDDLQGRLTCSKCGTRKPRIMPF